MKNKTYITNQNFSVLVMGYGSIGKRHAKILKNKFNIKNIYIYTKQKIKQYNTIENLSDIKKINPSYFIISSPTSQHYNHLRFIERNFRNKKILVEKPLFDKFKNLNIRKNNVFVGYNLRYNPLIKYLKKILSNKKIIDIKIFCNSYLPYWRKKRDYKKSSSASKFFGGGVILDLSHELDYVRYLFGNVSIKFIVKGKFSNLRINTEDLLKLYGKIKKTNLSIDLNYYSKIERRTLSIDGMNFSIFADLKKNYLKVKTNKSYYIKKFANTVDDSYVLQHKEILLGKPKLVCNYRFALDTMKLIDKIKNKKKN